jgi:hypothetical protein
VVQSGDLKIVPMFDSHAATLGGARHRVATRTGGVSGNVRLTGAVAVALLVLLAAEGVTIPFIGKWLGPHIFIGLMLIPPVALKLGSTGFRFARYYTGDEPYVRKGPPPTALRMLAPGVVLTTLALFGTGVALLLAGPPSNTLIFAHKLSFFAWVAVMALHVLGHVVELPRLASADWRRHGPREARLAGAGLRAALLAGAIALGAGLGAVVLTAGTSWH